MTRSSALPVVLLALATAACGPLEAGDEETGLAAADGSAPLAKTASAPAGLWLPSTTITAGGTLTGTVSAGQGAVVYLGFTRSYFAGPKFVRIPAGGTASFTLHVNPYLTAPVATAITARTQNPDPATFFSQAVTVVPAATSPATPQPQVASAIVSPGTIVTGGTAALAVTLTGPAPAGGAAIQLAISNDFFFLDAELPPVVLVPAGATSLSVPVKTHLSAGLTTGVTEYLVAVSFGGTFQGSTLTVIR